MKIKTALKAAAVAATLIFSGASHAAINYKPVEFGQVMDSGSMWTPGVQAVVVYELSGTSFADNLLAFCVEPTIDQLVGTSYTQHNNVNLASLFADNGLDDRASRIQALYDLNYASLSSGTDAQNSVNRIGFQLALWDLVADDGNLYTGSQAFTSGALALAFDLKDDSASLVDLVAVQAMLDGTIGSEAPHQYQFTLFTGRADGSDIDNSQALLSVSAVPEADTWAMLVAGLGLLGFVGRRKSAKSAEINA